MNESQEQPTDQKISIDAVHAIEVSIGTIEQAARVPDTDKLLRLMVNFGEEGVRQIVSGIAAYVSDPATLIGKQFSFVINLEPRTIRGLESNGMLFAVGSGETFAFLIPDRPVPPGTSAN